MTDEDIRSLADLKQFAQQELSEKASTKDKLKDIEGVRELAQNIDQALEVAYPDLSDDERAALKEELLTRERDKPAEI